MKYRFLYLFFSLICFSSLLQAQQHPAKVVLVVIDTLRADHLPMYGYPKNTASFLNELSKDSVVFLNTISTASYTAPATASIHTSLYPEQHGVLLGMKASRKINAITNNKNVNRIPEAVTTMGEYMKNLGYETFGIADNGNISKTMGFTQGFDFFRTYSNEGADKILKTINGLQQRLAKSSKYFLYLHYMDPHSPYVKHDKWFETKGDSKTHSLVRTYNSEIGYVDDHIRRVFKKLRLLDDSIVIFTSDHGEEFWEHGKQGHGKTLYNEVINVPFIIYAPGKLKPTRYPEAVSIIDIFPTLLGLLGEPQQPTHNGINLIPKLQAQVPQTERAILSNLFRKLPNGKEINMQAITKQKKRASYRKENSWKDSSKKASFTREFYNLQSDPKENSNLIEQFNDEHSELIKNYKNELSNGKNFTREYAYQANTDK